MVKERRFAWTYLFYLRNFAKGDKLCFDPNWKNGVSPSYQNEWYWLTPDPVKCKMREKGYKGYDEEFEKHWDTTYPDETPFMMMRIETDRRMDWFLKNMAKYGLIEPDGNTYKITEFGKQIHGSQGTR